ncbi:MAG: hypothetical protein ACPK7O_03720 [Methanobacterium sp.]
MDIGDYYYKALNGFTNNPNLAIPTLVGNVLIYVTMFIVGTVSFLIFIGPELLNSSYISPDTFNYGTITTIIILIAIMAIIIGIIYSFIYASTIGLSKRIIEGQKPQLSIGLRYGKKFFVKLFLISIIMAILFILASIPLIAGIILDYTYGFTFLLTIIGMLISLALWVVIALIFVFTYQSIVVSKKSVIGAFKDSIYAFKKRLFEVIVVLIINGLIIGIISIALFLLGTFLSFIPLIGSLISAIINIIVNTLMFPYFILVLTYLYMDIKEMPMTDYVH